MKPTDSQFYSDFIPVFHKPQTLYLANASISHVLSTYLFLLLSYWSRNRKDFSKRSSDSSFGFLFRPLQFFTFCRMEPATVTLLPQQIIIKAASPAYLFSQSDFAPRRKQNFPPSTWPLKNSSTILAGMKSQRRMSIICATAGWKGGRKHSQGVPTHTALFSHHSPGICPWVTVGRRHAISVASNPHGLSYTNVVFPLSQFSSKLLLYLLPGNPCKPSSRLPLCVPAMSHGWRHSSHFLILVVKNLPSLYFPVSSHWPPSSSTSNLLQYQ